MLGQWRPERARARCSGCRGGLLQDQRRRLALGGAPHPEGCSAGARRGGSLLRGTSGKRRTGQALRGDPGRMREARSPCLLCQRGEGAVRSSQQNVSPTPDRPGADARHLCAAIGAHLEGERALRQGRSDAAARLRALHGVQRHLARAAAGRTPRRSPIGVADRRQSSLQRAQPPARASVQPVPGRSLIRGPPGCPQPARVRAGGRDLCGVELRVGHVRAGGHTRGAPASVSAYARSALRPWARRRAARHLQRRVRRGAHCGQGSTAAG